MASVKLLLYTKKTYSDGTHPVILQIIHGKIIKRKVLANVLPEQWNEKKLRVKGHDNMYALNERIRDEFNRVEDLIIKSKGDLNFDIIFPKDESKSKAKLTFWQIADKYLEQLKGQSGDTYISFKNVIDKFKRCLEDDALLLSGINESHIAKYNSFMAKSKNALSTQNFNWRVIRFVSNFGADKKYDTSPACLHSFKLPSRTGATLKGKLTKEELDAFKNVTIKEGSFFAEARDIFLLAVYLRGARVSDMIHLKQEYIKDGRYVYKSSKNKKNFDIKLVPEALEIINKYKDGRKYLFHWYELPYDREDCTPDEKVLIADENKRIVSNINTRLMKIAKRAGITKKVRTHISRHTFAKLAADNIEDRRVTMALLGHSDLKTHQAYIMEVQSADELDNAVDGIF